MVALPTFYHSIQVVLSPETPSEQTIQAAHTLSISFINHFRQIISNPKSHHHTLLNPTHAIESLFLLLAQLYSHLKLTPAQVAQVADIILNLVTNTLSLLNDLCALAVKSAIYNEPLSRDYRDAFCRGILALVGGRPATSPLRQGVLLVLILNFRAARGSNREGRVACLARDDVLWYLYAMMEECVSGTGGMVVGAICAKQVQKLVWESLRSESGEMSKGDWLAWKVCGLLCGIGGVEVEPQE